MPDKKTNSIIQTAWDSKAFRTQTFEICSLSEEVFENASKQPGHYTVKVDPFSSKELLNKFGFYYCDSLIEPYCKAHQFIYFENDKISVSLSTDIQDLLKICHGAFIGRFHRDFNLDPRLADLRYDSWLKELYESRKVLSLFYENEIAGFLGYSGNKIILHALSNKHRGQKLAKYFWSSACKEIFKEGYTELKSSVSIANIPALNLYVSLGFRFRKVIDVYHRIFT